MKIAVFGGSFNPLHNGHAMLADTIIKELHYDKVLFVPTYMPPHKIINESIAPEHRIQMIKNFCESVPGNVFEAEDCEIARGGVSYTYDTLTYLTKKYNGKIQGKLSFVMGDEVAAEFHKWKNPQGIAELADFIITHRYPDAGVLENKLVQNNPTGDYKGDFHSRFDEKAFGYACTYMKEPLLPVSSTQVRGRIKEGRSFKYLVPQPVYEYIMEHNLYKDLGKNETGKNIW